MELTTIGQLAVAAHEARKAAKEADRRAVAGEIGFGSFKELDKTAVIAEGALAQAVEAHLGEAF